MFYILLIMLNATFVGIVERNCSSTELRELFRHQMTRMDKQGQLLPQEAIDLLIDIRSPVLIRLLMTTFANDARVPLSGVFCRRDLPLLYTLASQRAEVLEFGGGPRSAQTYVFMQQLNRQALHLLSVRDPKVEKLLAELPSESNNRHFWRVCLRKALEERSIDRELVLQRSRLFS